MVSRSTDGGAEICRKDTGQVDAESASEAKREKAREQSKVQRLNCARRSRAQRQRAEQQRQEAMRAPKRISASNAISTDPEK
eukprot:116273-Rhodomonas_salina.1